MELLFHNRRLIGYTDLPHLPAWQTAQLLDLAERTYAIEAEEAADVLDETYQGSCELWDVVDADEPDIVLYDCWVFDVDTAVIFHHQTTEDAKVWMVQHYFDVSGDQVIAPEELPVLEELAAAFQDAYDRAENEATTDDGDDSALHAYRQAIRETKEVRGENKSDES